MINNRIADCIATLQIREEINGGKDFVLQIVEELVKAFTKIGFHEATTITKMYNVLKCQNEEISADFSIEFIL